MHDLKTKFIGDFILSLGTDETLLSTRNGTPVDESSAEIFHFEGARLVLTKPSKGWKGYPLYELHTDQWDVWLIGELYPLVNNQDEFEDVMTNFLIKDDWVNMNGHFFLIRYHKQECRWEFVTNRLGTIHAYLHQSENETRLSTSLTCAASGIKKRDLNWSAIASFFQYGFYSKDETLFRNVRLLSNASKYAFNGKGALIQEEKYWTWNHQVNHKRTYDQTVSDFADVFDQIVSDLSQSGKIAVPISGGLDSRSVAASISRSNNFDQRKKSLWSFSYGYEDDSEETSIGNQVAQCLHYSFDRFTIKPYLFEKMNPVTDAIEGFEDVTQCRQAFVQDELEKKADYIMAAHWGDVWLDDLGWSQTDIKATTQEKVVEDIEKKFSKEGSAWLIEKICSDHLNGHNVKEKSHQMITEELQKYSHIQDVSFKVKAFKTDAWSFRWTLAGIRTYQMAAFPRLPFYDNRFVDFISTVPSEYLEKRRLQVDYLKKYAPSLAKIKWQAYDENLYQYQYSDNLYLPKRAIKKLMRMIKGKKVLERNWEVQLLSQEGREKMKKYLCRKDLGLYQWVSREDVDTLIEDFYRDPYEQKRGYSLSMLITFAAALERLGVR